MAPVFAKLFRSIQSSTRDDYSSLPQAPSANSKQISSSNDGWSSSAIIGIVAGAVLILAMIPLVATILRRYEKRRYVEMLPKDAMSPIAGSIHGSIQDGSSLKNILVTKEVQRSSLRMTTDVKRPDEAYKHGRWWSHTEVRGGDQR